MLGAALLLLATSRAEAAIVTYAVLQGSGTFSATTVETQGWTAYGNFMVCGVRWLRDAGQDLTIADMVGNNFTQVAGSPLANGNDRLAVYYVPNMTGGDNRVTATFSAATTMRAINCSVYNGVATTAPLDIVGTQTQASGGTITSSTFTTTAADEIIVAFASEQNGGNTWSSGELIIGNSAPSSQLATGDYVYATWTTSAVTMTTSETTMPKSLFVVTFRPLVAAGGGGSSRLLLLGIGQ